MRPVPAGPAGNQNAAEPARTRKQELKAILARPLSRTGARAGFWDVPALRDIGDGFRTRNRIERGGGPAAVGLGFFAGFGHGADDDVPGAAGLRAACGPSAGRP